jgi:5-methyltetrahydropteroyltriglutamate--homocysteine methyltransferase
MSTLQVLIVYTFYCSYYHTLLPFATRTEQQVVNARSVWRADPAAVVPQLRTLQAAIGDAPLRVQPSSSLQFVPWDLSCETELQQSRPAVAAALAFAVQKLAEVTLLARVCVLNGSAEQSSELKEATSAWEGFRAAARGAAALSLDDAIKAAGDEPAFVRAKPFAERKKLQLPGLPPLPTTTIGSFPQVCTFHHTVLYWIDADDGNSLL